MQLPTPSRCVPSVTFKSLLFHTLAFSWSCYGTYYDRTVYILPRYNEYGGRFQYLTLISAYVCLVSYGFAVLVDLLQTISGFLEDTKITKNGYQHHNSFLISLRDDLITFWSFTLSTFVSLMFWGIAAVDLKGVHTAEEEKVSPLLGWYNQYLHTTPILITFFLITNINYGYSSFLRSLIFILTLGTSYLSWITHLANVNGYWVYPFMEKLSRTEYAIFCVFAHLIFFVLYLIGRKVASMVWHSEYKEKIIIDIEQKRM